MSKHYHEKFIAYIKHLLHIEKHSMENISKKTGIPMDDLKKYHEEDDIANKFEYEKLMDAFDPDKKKEECEKKEPECECEEKETECEEKKECECEKKEPE
ncbi:MULTISPECIES: hypothetical protein [Psychrilyobacter]|uniref:Uncharacterized protein n=1 Tax=Psychrilyobacter piezotolerans TaxID=2293438 RepID=A0ABX9KFS9_9FUSO|nr:MULTISPECIES: hypothetical protein [Psychrilyobacter]MCS5420984.1 hypothetical protein [Psychrilyobacter sp. S5]NDI78785.1 hypothetical protein [Psychrilyobacter piezotolerans]RDE60885.1 hypothetical protein DV867_10240 [Psychrilyobacter sp. S5]REI40674.1 hypothetical protein DYH56_10240 [Psychrilyobacter piezotolerans]